MNGAAAWPIKPPVEPVRPTASQTIPAGDGWLYEPKWDGWRALLWTGDNPRLDSRRGNPLAAAFPEVTAASQQLPAGSVLDGELCVLADGTCSFQAIAIRGQNRRNAHTLAEAAPATYIVYDILAWNGKDIRRQPLAERKDLLETEIGERIGDGSVIVAGPSSNNRHDALQWWEDAPARGWEGLVAKPTRSAYTPKAGWRKIKRRQRGEYVICGYRLGAGGRLHSLILDHINGDNWEYVGEAAIPAAEAAHEVAELLAQLEIEQHQFGRTGPWIQNRWEEYRNTVWRPIQPVLAAEVEYDRIDGNIMRHRSHLIRVRPILAEV